MIGCIISFIAGGFAGALVMALCAASKNSNVNIILEDTNGNIVAGGSVSISEDQEQKNIIGQPQYIACKHCAMNCPDSIKEIKNKKGRLKFATCEDWEEK